MSTVGARQITVHRKSTAPPANRSSRPFRKIGAGSGWRGYAAHRQSLGRHQSPLFRKQGLPSPFRLSVLLASPHQSRGAHDGVEYALLAAQSHATADVYVNWVWVFRRLHRTCLNKPRLVPGGYPDASWVHTRRHFHKLLDEKNPAKTPIAAETIARIQQLYAVEAEIRGRSPDERRAARQEKSAPSGRAGLSRRRWRPTSAGAWTSSPTR